MPKIAHAGAAAGPAGGTQAGLVDGLRLVGAASSPAAAGSSAICVGISPGEHGGVGAGAARPFQKIKVGGGLTQSTLLQSFFVGKGEGDVDDGNGGGSGDGNNDGNGDGNSIGNGEAAEVATTEAVVAALTAQATASRAASRAAAAGADANTRPRKKFKFGDFFVGGWGGDVDATIDEQMAIDEGR